MLALSPRLMAGGDLDALGNQVGALEDWRTMDIDGTLADEPYTMGCRFMQGFVPSHDAETPPSLPRIR